MGQKSASYTRDGTVPPTLPAQFERRIWCPQNQPREQKHFCITRHNVLTCQRCVGGLCGPGKGADQFAFHKRVAGPSDQRRQSQDEGKQPHACVKETQRNLRQKASKEKHHANKLFADYQSLKNHLRQQRYLTDDHDVSGPHREDVRCGRRVHNQQAPANPKPWSKFVASCVLKSQSSICLWSGPKKKSDMSKCGANVLGRLLWYLSIVEK